MPLPQIKIYTTSWCAFCRAEKQFFDTHRIQYEAVDVEHNQAAANEMVRLSGQMGVPFTVIKKPGGETVGILGFDQPRLSSILGIN